MDLVKVVSNLKTLLKEGKGKTKEFTDLFTSYTLEAAKLFNEEKRFDAKTGKIVSYQGAKEIHRLMSKYSIEEGNTLFKILNDLYNRMSDSEIDTTLSALYFGADIDTIKDKCSLVINILVAQASELEIKYVLFTYSVALSTVMELEVL